MKTPLLFRLALLLLLGIVPRVRADSFPAGQYRCTVEFGDLLLAGRYPFEVEGVPGGSINMTTSPTGEVDAEVTVFSEKEPAVGTIRVRDSEIRLVLRGKVDAGRIRVNAVLEGSAFVGTATLRGIKAPCRMDITGIAPIRAQYVLDLSANDGGKITGNGVLTVEQLTIPVKARGQFAKGKVALKIKAGKTFLKTKNGEFSSVGFAAQKWSAQGFGALRKGRNLKFTFSR